ncbi:MAG: aromatic hydrocarbon degradation protein [Sphingobacteriales bacterium]|nr:aromatic hydrocarbon degradation protein [Sphingobacteriales bacterium]
MKKILFILSLYACTVPVYAQEPTDALRYSWTISSGTARQQAVGGAMASLGGDLSAAYVNPAGLGFYKTGDFILSPGYNLWNNKATYYNRTEKDKRNYLSFGTSGLVIGSGTERDRKGRNTSAAFALAINRSANFGSNLLYRGANNQNSYSQKFLEEIAGEHDANNVANNYPFGTSLAFNTYWIDTINGGSSGNFQFQTRSPVATGLIQENIVTARGGITELALAFAAALRDKFFYGFTLGVPFLHYDRESIFTEADAGTDVNNKFDFASITQNLVTKGTGLNLKMGIIYKPVEYVRLGLAFHTPSFYRLTDRYNATVSTHTEGYKGLQTQSSHLFTGDQDAEFGYWMFTPYRIIGSASYVLREIEDVRKQKGFLTADIEYVNYKATSYTTDPEGDNSQGTKNYLKSLNKAIDNAYKGSFNFRAGGELKFTTIMARLGLAYYGNPYKDIAGEKGNRLQLSGGLGYRNKGMFIDLTYVHTMGKDVDFAYRLQNQGYSGARLKQTGGNVLLTLGFKI